MSDIFISYASEDRPRVESLAKALHDSGWSIWWDRQIPIGKRFDDVIEEALAKAKCIIVVWSRNSISSSYVRAEASEGAERQILLPVMIDEVKIPLAFRQIQTARLVDWHDSLAHPEFEKLVKDIHVVAGKPLPSEQVSTMAHSDAASQTSTPPSTDSAQLRHTRTLPLRSKVTIAVVSVLILVALAGWAFTMRSRRETPASTVDFKPAKSPDLQPGPSNSKGEDSGSVKTLSDLVNNLKVTRVAFLQGDCTSRPGEERFQQAIKRVDLSRTRWFLEIEHPKASRRIAFSIFATFYDSQDKPKGQMNHPETFIEPGWTSSWHCSEAGLMGTRSNMLATGSYRVEFSIWSPRGLPIKVHEVKVVIN